MPTCIFLQLLNVSVDGKLNVSFAYAAVENLVCFSESKHFSHVKGCCIILKPILLDLGQ